MATTGDSPLYLTKPEATDVVSLPVINANYDTINAKAAAVDGTLATHTSDISALNTTVGAGGSVVKAQNLVGGAVKRIPVQSAANTTTFVAAPAADGQVLISGPVAPYVGWSYPTPYKFAAGTIAAADFGTTGISPTVDLSSYGFTSAPVVTVTPVTASMSTAIVASISSTPTTAGFVVRLRTVSSTGTVAASNPGVVVHWTAVQIAP